MTSEQKRDSTVWRGRVDDGVFFFFFFFLILSVENFNRA